MHGEVLIAVMKNLPPFSKPWHSRCHQHLPRVEFAEENQKTFSHEVSIWLLVGRHIETSWLRSEEHTSELQSHSDLVCRLLLEKKKKNRRGRWAHRLRIYPIKRAQAIYISPS